MPLDDGWIHATYARNLALHGQLCLNPGEPSTGTTSFLWTGLLAAAYLAFHAPVLAAILIGIGLQAGLVVCVFQLVRDARQPDGVALAAAASCALLGPLVWLSLSGMENTLFLALGLTAVLCRGRGRLLTAGILAGLLVLTRPEGLALAAVLAAFEVPRLARERGRAFALGTPNSAIRAWLRLFLPVAACAALYFAINLAITGHLLTSTYSGRRWLYQQPAKLDLGLLAIGSRLAELAGSWAEYLYRWVFGTLLLDWLGAPRGEAAGAAIAVLMTLVAVLGLAVLWRRPRPSETPGCGCPPPFRLLLAWAIAHNLAYGVLLHRHGHAGRYQAVNYVLLALLVTLGAVRMARARGGLRAIGLGALALWLALCVGSAALWRQIYCDCVAHIDAVHVACGRWIAANLPPDAVVATFDLGAISYFSERRVVDMGGLVDPEMARHLFAGDIVPYLRRQKATHLALPLHYREDTELATPDDTELATRLGLLPWRPGDRPRLVLCAPLWSVPLARHRLHHLATSNAMPIMALYRLEWPRR